MNTSTADSLNVFRLGWRTVQERRYAAGRSGWDLKVQIKRDDILVIFSPSPRSWKVGGDKVTQVLATWAEHQTAQTSLVVVLV